MTHPLRSQPQVSIHEAKTHLSKLLQRVLAGEEIIIAKGGHPIARLSSLEQSARDRLPGRYQGRCKIPEDFNAPLPEDLLKAFET